MCDDKKIDTSGKGDGKGYEEFFKRTQKNDDTPDNRDEMFDFFSNLIDQSDDSGSK